MPRQRKHPNNAAKQRAYRQRKKGERETQIQEEREKKFAAHHEDVVKPMMRQAIWGNEEGDLTDFKGADPK